MPFNHSFTDFVAVDTVKLFVNAADKENAPPAAYLLWGDGVQVLDTTPVNGRVKARARGRTGFIDPAQLGKDSLLELYFIDVGQGDGVLIKTPDFRHIMIDGGNPRDKQPSRKNASDFVDWKFVKDYGASSIALDAVLASHCDQDHIGGLIDLLSLAGSGAADPNLDATSLTLEAFYHAGVSHWKKPNPQSPGSFSGDWLGPTDPSKKYLIQLLGDRASAEAGLQPAAAQQLRGEWGNLIAAAVACRTGAGTPTPIGLAGRSLADLKARQDAFLPGFNGGAAGVDIRILGPVTEQIGGVTALPVYGSADKNTNGNSILLRIDYGRTRMVLTGDLNKAAHQHLLDLYAGQSLEFQCDVGKACHHGSGDVSFRFMQAMSAAVTVISSGDVEKYDHPKPQVVAAAGVAGHLTIEDDEVITPLVYSTELARSYSLGDPYKLTSGTTTIDTPAYDQGRIFYTETKPGDLRPAKKDRPAGITDVVAGLIYGLVNIRTDGDKILCATMNEGDGSFAIRTFQSRF